MYRNFLVFLLCIVAAHSWAITNRPCDLSLSGTLRDKNTGERLSFATIYVEELKSGAISDDKGYFKIEGLCGGAYTLRITHLACHTLIKKVTLAQNLILNIELDHSAHELEGVNISAKRNYSTIGQVMERIDGIELLGKMGENLGSAIAQLSGVSLLQTGSSISKPVIHGMHSNRVLILNNGIRQEGQQWGAEHAPEIDPFIAKKITVLKGANGVRYGSDAIAGVILVEPNDLPEQEGINSEVQLTGASNGKLGASSGLVEGNIKQLKGLQFRLQGSLKKGGNIHTPNYYLKNTGLTEHNFSAAIGYTFKKIKLELFQSQFNTQIGIFSAAHIGNLSDLKRAFEATRPLEEAGFSYKIDRPMQNVAHELSKIKLTYDFSNFNRLSIIFARQYNQREEFDKDKPRNDSIAALNRPEFEYSITTHSIDVDYALHNHNGFDGNLGVNGMLQANTYSGRYFIPNFRNRSIGAYFIERYQFNKWQLEAGVRADYRFLEIFKLENKVIINPQYNYFNPSGTIGAQYNWNDHLQILVNSGSAWRAPAPNELFSDGLHHGSATFELGDRNLKLERAWNNNLSINYQKGKLSTELALYYNRISNFINLVPSGETRLTIRGAFPEYIYVQQDAAFKGIDWSAKYAINKVLSTAIQYNMVRSKSLLTKEFLPQIPADRTKLSLSYQAKDLRSFKATYFQMGASYFNKQWRAPISYTVIKSNGESLLAQDFIGAPKAALLFDLELGTQLSLGKYSLQIVAGVDNLLNTAYRSYLNRFRYFADEQGRNFKIKIAIPFSIYKPKTN